MLEYASSRFTFFCTIAAQLPTIIESAASTPSTGTHPAVAPFQNAAPASAAKPMTKNFAVTIKLATFDPVAMNAVTGVGAPSYASGAHKWNGTTATLKPN